MRCPRCGDALEPYEPQRRVTAHACPVGHGAFLARDDLQRALSVAALGALLDAPAVAPGPACPACAAPMTERALERHGDRIDLDGCVACDGVWFDSGELARAQAPPPSPDEGAGAGAGAGARQLHGTPRYLSGDTAVGGAMVVADPGIWHAITGFLSMLFDS